MEDSSFISNKEAPSFNNLFSVELQEQLSSLSGLFKEPTLEELHSQLESVSVTYHDDDLYEFFEKDSHKIQLLISNNCDRYLEDVSVEVSIKKQEGLLVADRVYKEPEPKYDHLYPINIASSIKQFEIPDLTISYPFVVENDNEYLIHDSVRQVEQHKKAVFFSKPLRIKFGDALKDQQIFFECESVAKSV